jgi:hypothetical protein
MKESTKAGPSAPFKSTSLSDCLISASGAYLASLRPLGAGMASSQVGAEWQQTESLLENERLFRIHG